MTQDSIANTLLSKQCSSEPIDKRSGPNADEDEESDVRTKATRDEQAAPRVKLCPSEDELQAFALGELPKSQYPAIEGHFDECTSCFELVSELVRNQTGNPASCGRSIWDVSYGVDSRLANRFDILRFIDRGGMGEVYEAFDRDLREKVAVKTVLSSLSETPEALTQLREEVKLARRVAHPNVCRVHDLHVHADLREGRPAVRFLAMEFIEGITLKKQLQAGALSFERTTSIALQLLAGLEAAHSAGVLHLDLKSQNVMLRTREDAPEVAIMDFGLSRALDVEDRLRTSERRVAGSAGYMSPEQIQCRPVGPSSDLYSFGVILYEMLTGRSPFTGTTAISVMMRQLKEKPQAPSKLRPEISKSLDDFVIKCIHKNPLARFGSVDQARRVFEQCLAPSKEPVIPWRRTVAVRAGLSLGLVIGVSFVAVKYSGHDSPSRVTYPLVPLTEKLRNDPVTKPLAIRSPSVVPPSPEVRLVAPEERLVLKPAVETTPVAEKPAAAVPSRKKRLPSARRIAKQKARPTAVVTSKRKTKLPPATLPKTPTKTDAPPPAGVTAPSAGNSDAHNSEGSIRRRPTKVPVPRETWIENLPGTLL